ncbi:hypothetical protein [Myxococcus sp. CA040A]|uniref:hypothetical protein n=1 Tax=Myxococcus sp. CA040A TaxID=2741738 RepID=UPI00157AE2E9|nr:hypothetical protein [Myxococcus sp. CA040A]NTX07029.1 hypothetical protein [Myxococcus sp. CA040A]
MTKEFQRATEAMLTPDPQPALRQARQDLLAAWDVFERIDQEKKNQREAKRLVSSNENDVDAAHDASRRDVEASFRRYLGAAKAAGLTKYTPHT